jgi:hypothetical protein
MHILVVPIRTARIFSSLVRRVSLNTFTRPEISASIPIARQRVGKHISATTGRLLLGNGVVNTLFNNKKRCFVGSAPRLYNEDLTQLEWELGQVLEMAVEGD